MSEHVVSIDTQINQMNDIRVMADTVGRTRLLSLLDDLVAVVLSPSGESTGREDS